AAARPVAAGKVPTGAGRTADIADFSPSLTFGVRRNVVWKRMSPRKQAIVTTQLNANQTWRPAIASRQVHRVLSFIAHTARTRPVARKATGRPSATPVILRIGSWWCIAVDRAVRRRSTVKQNIS